MNSRAKLDALIKSSRNWRRVRWLRTGIASVDLVIGGGFPLGRFAEVVGNPSTCKTALALAVCKAAIEQGGGAAYLDPEAKLDVDWAVRLGVPMEKLIYRVPDDLEDTLNRAIGALAAIRDAHPEGPAVVALDSIAATALDKEIERIEEEGKVTVGGQVGNKARATALAFPSLMRHFWKLDGIFLGLNHLKTHMGAYFSSYLESPGGRALWYHASVRLKLIQKGKIKGAEDRVEGIELEVEAIKNNVSAPFRSAQVPFRFDTGFDPWEGAVEVLYRAGRIKLDKPGLYSLNGKTFRAKSLQEIAEKHPEILEPIR